MSFALITGASKGIGKAISEVLALKGYNLLLVARSGDLLEAVVKDLSGKNNKIIIQTLALDLSQEGAATEIHDWVKDNGYEISILVNNAGYGLWGNFEELLLEEQNNMMQLNMHFLVNLTHKLIPVLKKQKKAYILNVASTTAYQAIPTLSLYSATKSFVVSFTRGLRHELRNTSVSVSCLSPGTTRTGFIQRSRMLHMEKTAEKFAMEPSQVARIAVRNMLKGKAEIIPGFINRFSAELIRFLPKSWVEKAAGNIYKKA
jgi:uncharacterized protein